MSIQSAIHGINAVDNHELTACNLNTGELIADSRRRVKKIVRLWLKNSPNAVQLVNKNGVIIVWNIDEKIYSER